MSSLRLMQDSSPSVSDSVAELVAEELSDALNAIADEFAQEATQGGRDAPGLKTAAAVLHDLAIESMIVPPQA